MALAHGLVIGALLLACAVVVVALAVWRDPRRLIRAEFARERILGGFALKRASIEGCGWCWVERAAERADAPTLVMVHGYTGSKENWYRLCARLGRRYRLVVPDLPGWGDSERVPAADHGFVAQAGNVAAFLRALDAGPVTLLGHSMGGGIAALVAAREPQLVDNLVLLDAAGAEFAENNFGRAVVEGDNPFAVTDARALQRYFEVIFHDAAARPPLPWPGSWAYVAYRRRETAFEQSVLDRIGRGEERFLPWQEADTIRQPTLLVWGAHDQVIDPSAMALYAQRIPHTRQQLLDGSGHMTLMEQADAVADAVVALMEDAAP